MQDHVLAGVQGIVGYQHKFRHLLELLHCGQVEKAVMRHPCPSGTKLLEAWNQMKEDNIELAPIGSTGNIELGNKTYM